MRRYQKRYKESFDALVESGKFSDLESKNYLDDFEENYRAMRNPEKYKPDDELINHIERDQEKQE